MGGSDVNKGFRRAFVTLHEGRQKNVTVYYSILTVYRALCHALVVYLISHTLTGV